MMDGSVPIDVRSQMQNPLFDAIMRAATTQGAGADGAAGPPVGTTAGAPAGILPGMIPAPPPQPLDDAAMLGQGAGLPGFLALDPKALGGATMPNLPGVWDKGTGASLPRFSI